METYGPRDAKSLSAGNEGNLVVDPDVSVCIVTYHARDLLKDCLESLSLNTDLKYEVIVVDNGSQDGVRQMLESDFPTTLFLENSHNEGYTRPMNVALKNSTGRYLLQLNPDTIILPKALDNLVEYMDQNPEIGICGPRVLNRDLSLQKPCRRGESTPWAVISYFTGLATLFPKSPVFGQYLLTYLDENQPHPVAGISGSCMLIRRAVIDNIGYLDEHFVAYQEDADFCFRARNSNWKVFYYPGSQIIHYGGMGGSQVEPYKSILYWHRSYFLYYKKNLSNNYLFLFNWLYYVAMFLKFLSALIIRFIGGGKVEKVVNQIEDEEKISRYS